MKKLLLVSVAFSAIAASGAVQAADLPLKAPALLAPVGYDWSGIYLGGHIGGGWATNDMSDPSLGIVGVILGLPAVQTTDSSGFLGGVQGGWNYQIGRLVVGTEVDFSWSGINGTNTSSSSPIPGLTTTRALTANTDWSGTSTVRLGYARDRVMFYSKAGAAWAHTNYTDNATIALGPAVAPLFTGTGAQTRVGWTVGTGVEWAFWNNWSAKVEYDYLNLGSKTVAVNGTLLAAPASLGLVNSQAINEVKVGLNYRFMNLP
jgi:outer membrane immunogenic protein